MKNCKDCYWYGIYDDQEKAGMALCCAGRCLIKLSPPFTKFECRTFAPKTMSREVTSLKEAYEHGIAQGKEEREKGLKKVISIVSKIFDENDEYICPPNKSSCYSSCHYCWEEHLNVEADISKSKEKNNV